MPELPEVETVCRGVAPTVLGRRIETVWIGRPDLRRPVPPDLAVRLVGRRVAAVDRRGKVMLWRLDDGGVVLLHLGMSGRIAAGVPAPLVRHDHLRFGFEGGGAVTFHDPRRFGFVDYVAQAADLARDPLLSRLGPEPLAADFTAAALAVRLAGHAGPVKTVLLDQTVVAGLGNIYVCESLFRARISPFAAAEDLSRPKIARLAAAIREVLTEAVAAGGSTLRDHRTPDGGLGYFQMRFAVYDRAGEACCTPGCAEKSGHRIKRVVQSGRATYYCPGCQR